MFGDFQGKKLLILGCTRDECQIVEAAKRMNIYTIVTDNNLDWRKAPAKYIADEAWDISWADIDTLEKKAREAQVSGVMAGYSEFRTVHAIRLSKALGTPFYIESEDQLLITRDKKMFKDICRRYNVPVANDFEVDLENYEESLKSVVFPVIVKPTDNAGSRGIRSCEKPEDLRECIDYALSYSESKRFIVEELIKGYETTIYYTIANGEIACSSIFEKYPRVEGDGFNALPDCYFYPSVNAEYFMKNHNEDVVRMLKGMGLKNGVISLQSFVRQDGTMAIFELGFRLGGTNSYHYTKYYNDVSFMDMMISYCLTGNMHPEELAKENPAYKGNYACTFTLLARNGIISEQCGEEEVRKLPNILHTCFFHGIGTRIVVDGSQFPKAFRCYIVGKSVDEIKDTIRHVQKLITIKDENGENMLYPDFDVELLNRQRV